MESMLLHTATVFMGFFAIMNPIANVPIFLGLTGDDDQQTTKAVALRSLMLTFLIIAIFSVAGKLIFEMFGITLPAFRITGGLLVLLIGFNMLQGDHSSVHQLNEEDSLLAADLHRWLTCSILEPVAMHDTGRPGCRPHLNREG